MAACVALRAACAVTRPRWLDEEAEDLEDEEDFAAGFFAADAFAAGLFAEDAEEFFAAGADLALLAELRELASVLAALLRCEALLLALERVFAALCTPLCAALLLAVLFGALLAVLALPEAEDLALLAELRAVLFAALRLPDANVLAALLRWAALVLLLANVLAACFLAGLDFFCVLGISNSLQSFISQFFRVWQELCLAPKNHP